MLNHIYKEQNQKRCGKHYKCNCRCTFVVIFLQLRHNDKRSDFCFKRLVACNENNRTVLTKTSSECKAKACENRGKNFWKNNFSENSESAGTHNSCRLFINRIKLFKNRLNCSCYKRYSNKYKCNRNTNSCVGNAYAEFCKKSTDKTCVGSQRSKCNACNRCRKCKRKFNHTVKNSFAREFVTNKHPRKNYTHNGIDERCNKCGYKTNLVACKHSFTGDCLPKFRGTHLCRINNESGKRNQHNKA